MDCTIEHLVDTLQAAKERNRKACLLIGAGCSVKAGIPVASGFVERIRAKHPHKYASARKKTYPYCMEQLLPDEQRALIAEFVDKAEINWVHICIALLVQNGYVDRILTTNFDPLVIRACALLNIYPSVFDFAASQVYRPADIAGDAVFHLHGQRSGFIMLNTEEQLEKQKKSLKPVFEDASRGRTWIVVGYSGENDPVFQNLAEVEVFGGGLYWVGYKDNPPGTHVYSSLLNDKEKRAFLIEGYDADRFFIELSGRLGCFPPALVSKPFSHLESCLSMLTEFPLTDTDQKDVMADAMAKIAKAKKELEDVQDIAADATRLFMEGKYEEVLQFESSIGDNPGIEDTVAWAYIGLGNRLSNQARTKSNSEADRLFDLAGQKYDAALKIKPDRHEALYNWGNALADQAMTKSGSDADRLFDLAGQKYDAALKIKPDKHVALNNWGVALDDQARAKPGPDADRLFDLARKKYDAALAIKPDFYEALNNWGISFCDQAKTKSGSDAEKLYERAVKKLMKCEEIQGGLATYNLACVEALRGNEDECRSWLFKSKESGGLPDPDHLRTDTDFISVRDKQWFKDLLAELETEAGNNEQG